MSGSCLEKNPRGQNTGCAPTTTLCSRWQKKAHARHVQQGRRRVHATNPSRQKERPENPAARPLLMGFRPASTTRHRVGATHLHRHALARTHRVWEAKSRRALLARLANTRKPTTQEIADSPELLIDGSAHPVCPQGNLTLKGGTRRTPCMRFAFGCWDFGGFAPRTGKMTPLANKCGVISTRDTRHRSTTQAGGQRERHSADWAGKGVNIEET